MSRATILAGTGRFEDRWHDYPATSQQIADVLAEIGVAARIRGTRASTLADLDDTDILIVNSGNGRVDPEFDESDEGWEKGARGMNLYLASGRPAVGIHLACDTFHSVGRWLDVLGGHWQAGRTMHPPISQTIVQMCPGPHPVTQGLADFPVFDERYSYLALTAPVDVIATHEHDALIHPLAWTRQVGKSRIVYDALGHGVASYESPGRRRLLQREVLWALGADDATVAGV